MRFVDCGCDLCNKISELGQFYPSGGWADPRRYYSESEEEFLRRIPDGFIKWPEEHVDICVDVGLEIPYNECYHYTT